MQATSTLTEAQKQRFEDDGYTIMDLGPPCRSM